MSIDASGSIAGALTFAKWKGRNYVRQLVTPANPKSPAQTAFRAMFGFLAREWAGIDTLDAGAQATWDDLAEAGNYSAFNAFMRYNQDLWSRFTYPTVKSPPNPTSAVADTLDSATAGVKSVLLDFTGVDIPANWGTVIFRKVGSAPAGLQTEVIAIVQHINDSAYQFQDLGLTPGVEYHYRSITFSSSGDAATITADVDATPT